MNSRQVDDEILTLAPSGWTYDRTFVLYDHQTESMWYPVQNEQSQHQFSGISGQYAGRKLDPLPGEIMPWNEWVILHPETKLMDN